MASFLGDCNGKIIRAHTLSKKKSIAPIIEKGEFFIRGRNYSTQIEKSNNISRVTTFNGFCKKHDSELFSIFENENICFSDEKKLKKQCGLIRFRSLCKELYLKKCLLNLYNEGAKVLEKLNNENYQTRTNHVDAIKEGSNLAVKDLSIQLKTVEGQIRNENFNNVCYLVIKLPFRISITFDTSFVPELKKQEEVGRRVFESFSTATLFEKNCTYIFFIWHKNQYFCVNYMKNLEKEKNTKHVIYSLAFDHARELVISKSWWNSLDEKKKKAIQSGIYSNYFESWDKNCMEIIKRI